MSSRFHLEKQDVKPDSLAVLPPSPALPAPALLSRMTPLLLWGLFLWRRRFPRSPVTAKWRVLGLIVRQTLFDWSSSNHCGEPFFLLADDVIFVCPISIAHVTCYLVYGVFLSSATQVRRTVLLAFTLTLATARCCAEKVFCTFTRSHQLVACQRSMLSSKSSLNANAFALHVCVCLCEFAALRISQGLCLCVCVLVVLLVFVISIFWDDFVGCLLIELPGEWFFCAHNCICKGCFVRAWFILVAVLLVASCSLRSHFVCLLRQCLCTH